MTEERAKRNVIIRLFTSKFFWFALVLMLISCGVIYAIYNYAEREIEKARSIYSGLPTEGGYPYSTLSYDGFYRDEHNFLAYEDDVYYTRRGIDVSEHQGEIDWTLVAESGVQFAMIRLGYTGSETGEKHLDYYFENNIKGAVEAGIDVGVYYFSQAISVEEAISEAQFVCSNLKGKRINMPVVIDMEPLTGTEADRISGLGMMEITEISDAFCQIVEKHGYDVLIYGNPSWICNKLNLSFLTQRRIWLAHYTHFSDFPYKYDFWQYTDSGIIQGIETHVDLDLQFVKKE